MILKIDQPQFFYDLFYQLSLLIVVLIFLIEGTRRNLPWISLLLVIVTTRFFVIAGSKLAGINSDDLNFFIQHFSFPPEHTKNMAGALFFGLIGLSLAKLALRIKYPILDVFAIAAPFGMAIQRIGCLSAGCCFGIETHSPFGIQYGSNTPAYFHQLYAGRIDFADELSQHIHPVPLYFILSSLLIGIILLKFRNYWKRPGNLALSGLVLILLSWFTIEFFRDPLSNGTFLGAQFLGLKRIQIIYLIFIPILISAILYREKHRIQKVYQVQENHPIHNSLYLALLVSLIFITRGWFSFIEFTVLLFVLIPASIGVIIQIIKHFYSPRVRVSVAFITLLSFILMSQTLPENEKKVYQSIKFGYSGGNFDTYHNIGTGHGCDRVSQSQDFHQKFKMMGIGYSKTTEENNKVLEYGLNGYFGSHHELAKTNRTEIDEVIFGLNPFMKYDLKWVGIGGGFHVGDLNYTPADWVEQKQSTFPTTGTKKSPFWPQFYFRIGPKHIAYFSYKYADQLPSPFPGMVQNMEIGTGFGQKTGLDLRFGTFLHGSYLAATIPIKNRFYIEPVYEWISTSDTEFSNPNQISLGLKYRFGHKTIVAN